MRFCPHCGAPLMAGAKFCVECGRQLADAPPVGAGSSAQPKPSSLPSGTKFQLTTAFVVVFFGITVIGLGAAAYIMLRPLPSPHTELAQPPQNQADNSQNPQASGSAGQSGNGLPQGHPKIELPTEARSFIDKVEQEANAKPNSVEAWVKLGTVCMRAALFDQAYYQKASNAYAHVLKLDPDNLDALRGIGDIDYDQQHYDQAAAAYEHYLKKRPDDPEVHTDLGTMYLYTGNSDQAIAQYKKAIALKPDLFQPYYNLGVAYGEGGDKADATVAFTKAISLAPDDDRRNQAKQALAKYTGMPADQASKVASTLPPGSSGAPAASAKGTFHSSFEEMLRSIPFAGPKVSSVEWPADYKAKVLMDHFPMEAMPPFAKDKFLSDLKSGIDSAKAAHQVSSKVEVDIVDGQSGRVMQTVVQ